MDSNVINEVINETVKNVPGVITHKKPIILYSKVTPENYTISVRFWSTIPNSENARSEAMLKLSNAFAEKSIKFE